VGLHRCWTATESLLGRMRLTLSGLWERLIERVRSRASFYFGGSPRGIFAQAWPIGTTAIWIAVLLTAYVVFYYID
ncbi:MAG: hypothetical protein WBN31_09615, partial [Gammaproteobacteria bacterium]